MTIFVDSANPEEVRAAARLGFVTSVTTNPALIAAAGRPAVELLPELCAIMPGTVFYQLTAASVDARAEEAERALALAPAPGRIGLKIPATTENMALVSRFAREASVAVTAIFSGAQAIAACEAGVQYLLPYVNRTTRLTGDGPGFVRLLRAITDSALSETEIVAASIKSPHEAVEALLAGAHHLSLPLSVLLEMGEHPLSRQAIAEFERAVRGTPAD